jgi:peptidoglycan/xylan/chitin deacetylase (PgdA/CDA1 family)
MRVLLSEAVARSGIGSVVGRRYGGRGLIFMLHSVTDTAAPGQTLRCSLQTLENALQWVRREQLDIVTLDQALCRLAEPHPRKFVVFTFDDGYRDNISRVLPLMERYAAPFTIYVPTRILTRELNGWWLGLLPLVRDNGSVEVEPMDQRFDTSSQVLQRRAIAAISSWVFADGSRAEQLTQTFKRYRVDIEGLLDAEAMTVTEMQHIARNPLVTIGAHTVTHRFLSRLADDEVKWEVAESKRTLEQYLDISVDHFSYPYGAAGQREAAIVRDAGFKTAVTTGNGTLFAAHAGDERRYSMPRETLDEFDTPGCLHCRTRGVYRAIKSRGGDPVADFRHPV